MTTAGLQPVARSLLQTEFRAAKCAGGAEAVR
jgi:hypothetical protein